MKKMSYPQMNYPVYQPMYQPMYYYPPTAMQYPQQSQMMQNNVDQQNPQNIQQPRTQVSQTITRESTDYIPVPNKDVARNYPVAPGHTVNFRDENAPYIYRKTMGPSQFDNPSFEVIRLVKENEDGNIEENIKVESNEQSERKEEPKIEIIEKPQPIFDMTVLNNINDSISVLDSEIKEELNAVRLDIEDLKHRVEDLGKRKPRTPKKVGDSDAE